MSEYRSGFVTLVGRPNVGKSTLLNGLVGEKIAIVTDKPQTTRNRIQGIYTDEKRQIVFVDTPGIHRPRNRLGSYMVKVAQGALTGVDVVVHVVDGRAPIGPGDRYIASCFSDLHLPVLQAVNKVDVLKREQTILALDNYSQLANYTEIVPISALKGKNLPLLLEIISKYLPAGPQFYPEDMVTDQPERFAVAELIREQVLHLTWDEVPHSVAVLIEEMADRQEKAPFYIRATVLVERESQKGIIIGQGGRQLKAIGQRARKGIEELLGRQVYLDLWVKVKEEWRDREESLHELGYFDR
ncbi:MAG TPA: GTPase Era [Firmicutes bacterium]|nr:GTPase Era [Bacillota bacterium]